MSADSPDLDTSALAKWYLNESGSDEFVDFIRGQRLALITRLTVAELRSLLARRQRSGDITAEYQRDAIRMFETDVRRGFLQGGAVVRCGGLHRPFAESASAHP